MNAPLLLATNNARYCERMAAEAPQLYQIAVRNAIKSRRDNELAIAIGDAAALLRNLTPSLAEQREKLLAAGRAARVKLADAEADVPRSFAAIAHWTASSAAATVALASAASAAGDASARQQFCMPPRPRKTTPLAGTLPAA